MKTKKIFNQLNVHEREMIEEINHELSLTIPHQAPPLKKILQSLANGNQLRIGKQTYFDDPTTEEPDPLVRPLDITEVEELLQQTNSRLKSAADEIKKSGSKTSKPDSKPEVNVNVAEENESPAEGN